MDRRSLCVRLAGVRRDARPGRPPLVPDGGTDEGDVDAPEAAPDVGERDDEHDDSGGESDGGEQEGGDDDPDRADDRRADEGAGPTEGVDRSNVEVSEAGGVDPADPKWERPDLDDLPEFEVGADDPVARSGGTAAPGGGTDVPPTEDASGDPTAGMPNTARSPSDSRIAREGTEGFVAALELSARLPDDVRLPEQAADLVPAAVEAELERDVQSFAAAEFDDPSPHVDVLEFVERDGDVWLKLRLGVSRDAFEELDPEAIRTHALQELEGLI